MRKVCADGYVSFRLRNVVLERDTGTNTVGAPVSWTWTAVALAMARDGSSGGVIRTAVVTKDGVEREMLAGDKLPHFGYEG